MATKIPNDVDPGVYMLSGDFINQILKVLREERLFVNGERSALMFTERGAQGRVLHLNTALLCT